MESPEDLRGEALRRAWLDAGYSVTLREELPVRYRSPASAYALTALCLAIIFGGAWLIWQMF